MPTRQHLQQGHYYHVYNRGANKDLIYFNEGNYVYCLRKVKEQMQKLNIAVIAYCLMPNHYHFLLRQDGDKTISKFVSNIFNGYTQAVNAQQERSGTLFEGRFKDVWVGDKKHLMELCRYIHLNPVKANLAAQPIDWPFSNYLDWVGLRNGTIKDDQFIVEYFDSPTDYAAFVTEGMKKWAEIHETLQDYIWD